MHMLTAPRMPLSALCAGPTCILPGYHHVDQVSSTKHTEAVEQEHPFVCRAGTVALIDFDSWHRGSANVSAGVRYMCKFHFCRLHEPCALPSPSWAHDGDASWRIPERPADHPTNIRTMWEATWSWMLGPAAASAYPSSLATAAAEHSISSTTIPALLADLLDAGAASTARGLRAAYTLADVATRTGVVVDVLSPLSQVLVLQAREMQANLEEW